MNKDVSYVVLDEHTLNYLLDASPRFVGASSGSALRGGRDCKNGPVKAMPPPGFAPDTEEERKGSRPC